VEVTDRLRETGSAAGTYTIEPSGVREMAGSFENVFQTLQVFPGAVGINDDDGKLAVRGGGPEHNLIVVAGVQIHRPHRLGHFTASFLNPDTIECVSPDASGLDARYGGRLSSVTTIETRDGVPDRSPAASGSMGLMSGDVLLEGRLPKTETGSWWVTARGTYYRAVFDRFNRGVTPGFSDVQFKVALRPTERTRLTIFGLAGRETLRQIEIEPDGGEEFRRDEYRGDNRLGVLNLRGDLTLGLSAKHPRRVDSRRTPRRQPRGHQHDDDQQCRGRCDEARIDPDVFNHARRDAANDLSQAKAHDRSTDPKPGRLTEDHPLHVALAGADGHAQANLPRALTDRVRHEAVQP
jgi:hypothetical protein